MALQHIHANFYLPEINRFIVFQIFPLCYALSLTNFIDNFLYSHENDLRQTVGKNHSLRMKKVSFPFFLYQLFWTQACPGGMSTNGTQVPCEVPSLPNPTTRKGWPHHWGRRSLLFSNSDVGSFTSHKNKSVKVL